jgi:hypothetical protein
MVVQQSAFAFLERIWYEGAMEHKPRYVTNVAKAHEVILWLASQIPSVDVYHLVKAVYFAEKAHISQYGRPIVGDSYRAAPYGPLPQVIYGLLRRDPIDILALENNGDVQFRVQSERPFTVTALRDANPRALSESDIEALELGAALVKGKTFRQLLEETHGDPAYERADGELIDYRDMIADDDPQKDEKRAYIEETARDMAI